MKTPIVVMAVVGLLLCSVPATADPVCVYTVQDPIQDDWTVEDCVCELSTAPHNPDCQLIESWMVTWEGRIPCPSEYQNEQAGTTVQVAIQNMCKPDLCDPCCCEESCYFCDLYYVGDVAEDGSLETTFTNLDEWVGQCGGIDCNGMDCSCPDGPDYPGMAFKIDKVGENQPLVYESMTQDGCFEPGEIWEFVVQEYWNKLALPASALGSVCPDGIHGAIAAASAGNTCSAASIITPEPSSLVFIVGGLLGLALRRNRRRR